MKFKVDMIYGFENMHFNTEIQYYMHFPIKAFQIAFGHIKGKFVARPDKIYNCWITFKRETKKRMIITKFDLEEVKEI